MGFHSKIFEEEEEEEENLFVNQINTVQNVSEETNDWLPKRASLSSWSPKNEILDRVFCIFPITLGRVDLQQWFDHQNIPNWSL